MERELTPLLQWKHRSPFEHSDQTTPQLDFNGPER